MITKLIILLGTISLIAIIPIIDAITEPSVIIEMFSGQTTNPFEIKDSAGTTLFSIDTTGNTFPSSSDATRPAFSFTTNRGIITTVAVDNILSNPVILYRLQITNPDPVTNDNIFFSEVYSQVDLRRDTGTSGCHWGWIASDDGGATWQTFRTNNDNNVTFIQEQTFAVNHQGTIGDATDLAYALFNGDGATTCSYKDSHAYVEFILTDEMTVIEITP